MKLVRLIAFALAALVASPSLAADGPKWSEWSNDLFARAQAEQRFLIDFISSKQIGQQRSAPSDNPM